MHVKSCAMLHKKSKRKLVEHFLPGMLLHHTAQRGEKCTETTKLKRQEAGVYRIGNLEIQGRRIYLGKDFVNLYKSQVLCSIGIIEHLLDWSSGISFD